MAKTGMVSGIAGVIAAGAAFVALQAWTPPGFLLDLFGAGGGRRSPPPQEPRHKLVVRPEPAGTSPAVVTDADVTAARVRPAPPDGPPGVTLELSAGGRDRLAAYARDHAADALAVDVDGKVLYTRPASSFADTGTLDIAAAPPLEYHALELAARFGGAVVPPDPAMVQAARLVPALAAGFLVMALMFVVTRR